MPKQSTTSIQATEKSLRIIEGLIEIDGGTATELTNHLDMNKSTVYHHLQTLLDTEYIVKSDKKYHIGLKFLRVGEYARNRHELSKVGKPEVDKLAEKTKEMANLVVEEHGEGVFLYRSKGSEAVHMDTHTGKRLPLYSTAFGKAILAHLDDSTVERILDLTELVAHTENTLTDKNDLYQEFETIREHGYAFDREERLKGLRCVAAPILREGTVVGAISVSGPKNRLRGSRFNEQLADTVTEIANVIEMNLLYE